MKECPVCHLEYSDEAEFCAKCKTVLLKKPEKEPQPPTNVKGLVTAIAATCGFIGAIYLMTLIIYG